MPNLARQVEGRPTLNLNNKRAPVSQLLPSSTMQNQPSLIHQHLSIASSIHNDNKSTSSTCSEEEAMNAPLMRRSSSTGSPYPFPAAEKADGYFDIARDSVGDSEEHDSNYSHLNVASPTAVNPSGLALQRRLSAKEARQVWKTRCCMPIEQQQKEINDQPKQNLRQHLFNPPSRPSVTCKVSFVGQSQKA